MNVQKHRSHVIGLLPAGGLATRISPLPCSKELYPIGLQPLDGKPGLRPKVVIHFLLEKMRAAGITEVYVVLREGKWDIPAYFCSGAMLDMHLAYLIARLPYGAPYTLDTAYPFVRNSIVAFGFPDILIEPRSVFIDLLSRQEASDADVVLGLFPADQPSKMDMVQVDENGRVRDLVIQPPQTGLRYSWDVAVWAPAFTEFLHEYLAHHSATAGKSPELSVGGVIQAALRAGLRVDGIPVSDEPYLDIGTPEGLIKAVKRFS